MPLSDSYDDWLMAIEPTEVKLLFNAYPFF